MLNKIYEHMKKLRTEFEKISTRKLIISYKLLDSFYVDDNLEIWIKG